MKKITFLFISLVITITSINAKRSMYFSSGDLTSNLVNSICQDKYGFIWIATEYGLNKFNGSGFIQYLHNENDSTTLLGNYVKSLYVNRNNILLIGCNNGLQYYEPEADIFRKIPAYNNSSPHINGMAELPNGELWLVTSGMGILYVDKDLKSIQPKREISKKCGTFYLNSILLDSKKNLWIGTDDKGLIKINPENLSLQTYGKSSFSDLKIVDIVEDQKGRLFVCTNSTIEFFDEKNNSFIPLHGDISSNLNFKDLTLSKTGRIYIGTEGEGLKYIDPASLTIQTVSNIQSLYNFDRAKVHAVLEDQDYNLWLGCYFGGVLMFPNEPSQFDFWKFADKDNIISGAVISICKDSEGYIWTCIDNEGVYKYDYTGRIIARYPNLKYVTILYEDNTKTMWAGTVENGLGIFDKRSGKITYISGMKNSRIKSITEDNAGNLYISSFGNGFYKFNKERNELIEINSNTIDPIKGKMQNDWINALLYDKQGLLWLGHYKGIECYDTRSGCFLNLSLTEKLKKFICISLLEDRKGNILIGTNNGLFVYNKIKQEIKSFNTGNGLSNNVICGLEEDEEGNIWCSTFEGINQIKLNESKIINFYKGNGLIDWGYSAGASYKDKDGIIYFGGNSGVTSFSPKNISQKPYNRKVVVTNVYIRNQTINTKTLSNGSEIIEHCVFLEDNFNFSYLDDSFTFEVSTLDFGNRENIFYEYRLTELGDEWNTTLPGTNRISFNHLPYGRYTLEIRASKNGATTPISKFHVRITPPWYKSFFAYFLYILIAIALVLLSIFLYFRTRQEKFNEAKLKFFINISHEIRSPMTLIISPIEKMLKESHDEATTKLLHTVYRNTNRVLGLINQLLDIRKFEKGQMQLKYSQIDMVGFIEEIISIFDYQTQNRNIKLDFEHNMSELPVWVDKNNFDKILINLISNSFKYTQDGGEITIILNAGIDDRGLGPLRQYAEIKIIDSGIGIDKDKISNIFERFYQIDNDLTFSSIGSGIGLNLCKMLVEAHHGSITAKNREGIQGSCFTITIPLGNDHIKKEEILLNDSRTRITSSGTSIQTLPPIVKKNIRSKTNYKILVIDDEEEIRNFLREELEETYKVITCSNGKDAFQLLNSQQPNLIISDVMMPEMDGFTLLKKIKSNTNLSHIPVIMLTAKVEHEDKLEGLEKGADVYLAKPFNIDELHIHITNLIESRKMLKGKYSGAQDQEDKIKAVEFKSSDELLMEKVMKFINENISNSEMNVEMLAKSVGLSRVQLHRKLKEITGLPTGEFIRNLRLKQAAILLKEKKINITQIAYAVGFTNQTHFSTTFKKIYGVSPTEFVDQNEIV